VRALAAQFSSDLGPDTNENATSGCVRCLTDRPKITTADAVSPGLAESVASDVGRVCEPRHRDVRPGRASDPSAHRPSRGGYVLDAGVPRAVKNALVVGGRTVLKF
jgi:hypothetical protein